MLLEEINPKEDIVRLIGNVNNRNDEAIHLVIHNIHENRRQGVVRFGPTWIPLDISSDLQTFRGITFVSVPRWWAEKKGLVKAQTAQVRQ